MHEQNVLSHFIVLYVSSCAEVHHLWWGTAINKHTSRPPTPTNPSHTRG